MNRLLLFLMLIILSQTANSQKKEIRELVLAVVEKAVPPDFAYFHLVDSSFILRYAETRFDEQVFRTFFKENPDFDPEEFTTENTKTKKICWSGFKIPRARVNPYEKIPKYESQFSVVTLLPWSTPDSVLEAKRRNSKYAAVFLRIKDNWTEEEKNEAVRKEQERYANSLKPEDRKYFAISTPIFSRNHRYAIVEVRNAVRGWCQVYKKVRGKWIYQITLWHWVA
ncbi:hypothetical protein [Niabella aurantiaca]|uniref:hypothetical protein n=1 Tax=Niabella aurantiaca TaxID=379900 RepID=UPI00037E96F0|nr:hypothetical protein [Niabella aurantiaca]